jgi:hypothetical protein
VLNIWGQYLVIFLSLSGVFFLLLFFLFFFSHDFSENPEHKRKRGEKRERVKKKNKKKARIFAPIFSPRRFACLSLFFSLSRTDVKYPFSALLQTVIITRSMCASSFFFAEEAGRGSKNEMKKEKQYERNKKKTRRLLGRINGRVDGEEK